MVNRVQWSWVTPAAGLLVYDPDYRGTVRSGRDLFGTASFGQEWPDGFAPLATLDGDGDGWLSGAELDPLAVWRDHDSDAVATAGEVQPLCNLGVRRIRVTASGHWGRTIVAVDGVEMDDGSLRHLYDWVPTRQTP